MRDVRLLLQLQLAEIHRQKRWRKQRTTRKSLRRRSLTRKMTKKSWTKTTSRIQSCLLQREGGCQYPLEREGTGEKGLTTERSFASLNARIIVAIVPTRSTTVLDILPSLVPLL